MDERYQKAISFDAIYMAFGYARKGSFWKDSIINFDQNRLTESLKISRQLQNGTYKLKGYYRFDVMEREKVRHIQSLHITDRVFQRSLCDNVLIPVMYPTFVYDNGASQKDKGTSFARDRLKEHLQEYYRKYGAEGYILQVDISKYFDSLSHDYLKKRIDRQFSDIPEVQNTLYEIVDSFGDKGLGLGSQVCQILALDYLSPLDHFIKDLLRVKFFGRYMDDMYLIHHDKEFLRVCKDKIEEFLKGMELQMHPHKTQLHPIKNGINFLGYRFILTESGKVYAKVLPVSIKRIKRRIRKMCQNGVSDEEIRKSERTWEGHVLQGDNYYTRQKLRKYMEQLLRDRRMRLDDSTEVQLG